MWANDWDILYYNETFINVICTWWTVSKKDKGIYWNGKKIELGGQLEEIKKVQHYGKVVWIKLGHFTMMAIKEHMLHFSSCWPIQKIRWNVNLENYIRYRENVIEKSVRFMCCAKSSIDSTKHIGWDKTIGKVERREKLKKKGKGLRSKYNGHPKEFCWISNFRQIRV